MKLKRLQSNEEKIMTYSDEEFQSYILAKTKNFLSSFRSSLYENVTISKMAGLAFVCGPYRKVINVVDLGGGAGIDFFIAKELFGSNLKWDCIETDVMCKIASREKLDPLLKFISMRKFLIQKTTNEFSLYSNSSLQYIPHAIDSVNKLLLKKPIRVAILRTPFVLSGDEVNLVQSSKLSKNGPQLKNFPLMHSSVQNSVTILKLQELREVLNKNGYEIICENVQDGNFAYKQRVPRSWKSSIKTIDILARRLD